MPLSTFRSLQSAPVGANAPTTPPEAPLWRGVLRWLPLTLGHVAVLATLYAILYCFGILQVASTEKNLLQWDAGWYDTIRGEGYVYKEEAQSNVAFFPLFPYLWRFTGLGFLGISLLNVASAALGVATLSAGLSLSRRQGMLLASVPLLMFTLVPYTEALFYLFSALLLVGLHKQRTSLLLLGLVGCCLTRTAATFFVPALLFTEFISWLETRETKRALINIGLGLLVIGMSVGGVLALQQAQTGEWFGFYKTQRHWLHWWRMPDMPLYSTAGINMLWLDGISIATALGAFLAGLYLFITRIWHFRRPGRLPRVPRALPFSLVYCACVGVFILFQQGGDIANSSRYILGTAFFAVILWVVWQQRSGWQQWVAMGAALLVAGRLLGIPNRLDGFWPGQAAWYGALLIGYATALALAGRRYQVPYQRELSGALYLGNVLLQVFMLNWFLQSVWLG